MDTLYLNESSGSANAGAVESEMSFFVVLLGVIHPKSKQDVRTMIVQFLKALNIMNSFF